MKLTVVTHYSKDDPDCYGDYCAVTIRDEDGNVVKEFGDYYHDKGDIQADSFIEGIEWALKITVEREDISIADSEY